MLETSETVIDTSKKNTTQHYRSRFSERALVRAEILGCGADHDVRQSLAPGLAEDGSEVSSNLVAIDRSIASEPPKTKGILAAFRRSPLVDADLDPTRLYETGRKVEI